MTLVPAFEIGLWNAWLFVLVFILYLFILMLIFRSIRVKRTHSGGTGKVLKSMVVLMIIAAIYSIFLPLVRGTGWFYAGSAIFLIGMVIIALAAADVDATPEGEIFASGMYRYSRHPVYISFILIFLGTAIASASWLLLVVTAVYIVLSRSLMIREERVCIEQFGEVYQQYINRTPRWLGLPKSVEKPGDQG